MQVQDHQTLVRVDMTLCHDIAQFLYREARLLDTERWDDWLAILAEDIHYWMPLPENRRRADKLGAYEPGGPALFDDNLFHLKRRVTRFKQPSAWAEDPPTRHVHVVSAVEAYHTDNPDEFVVHSTIVNYRSRVERDNDTLIGRREDLIRRTADGFQVARRKIITTQGVFLSKNLNTFL